MMMHARQPMFVWWGPDLVQFYNDGYVPSTAVAVMRQKPGRDASRERRSSVARSATSCAW
jgi:hypothetical protein